MTKQTTESIKLIKEWISALSDLWLQIDTSWEIWEQIYSKKDLSNVILIFAHILWNVSSAYLLKEKWINEWLEICESEFTKLKDIVFNLTWIDTHKILD